MLLVQIDGTLSSLVADDIAMSQILSNDAGSWLLLLSDLIAITLSLLCIVASIILARASGTGDLDVSGTKLGVVEEESSLRGGLLFESYGGFLGLAGRLDLNAGNLTTVTELGSFKGVASAEYKSLFARMNCGLTRRRRSP